MEDLRKPESTKEVEMGTIVSQYPIDLYKVSENLIDLVTILTKDPIVTKTAYHDKIGFRFHELPESVNVGLLSKVHYNFLVVVWNADREGKSIVNNKYTIAVMKCPEGEYKKLCKKQNIHGDLRQHVLQISLDGEVKYQGKDFEVDTSVKPPFLADKDLFDKIKLDVKEFKQYVPFVVASKIDGNRFTELWKQDGTAIEKQEEERFANRGMVQSSAKAIAENVIHKENTISDVKDVDFEETPAVENKANAQTPVIKQAPPVDSAAEKVNSEPDKSGKFFNNTQFSFDE